MLKSANITVIKIMFFFILMIILPVFVLLINCAAPGGEDEKDGKKPVCSSSSLCSSSYSSSSSVSDNSASSSESSYSVSSSSSSSSSLNILSLWPKRLGGIKSDYPQSVTSDKNNNIIITGVVEGDADLNQDRLITAGTGESASGYGNQDIFLVKFNNDGSYLWSKRLGTAGMDFGFSVITDSNNNIILTGYVSGSADLNGDGDRFDGSSETSLGIGYHSIFISVFDTEGNFLWAKRMGGYKENTGFSLAVDSHNNIAVTGFVTGDADLNGDGDNTDMGAENSFGFGERDVFISVFDSSGTHQWSKRFGSLYIDMGYCISFDKAGNIIIAGEIYSSVDFNNDGDALDGTAETGAGYDKMDVFILKLNAQGSYLWSLRLGGTGFDHVYGMAVDAGNNIIVSGQAEGNADLNGDGDSLDGGAESASGFRYSDIFIAKFDTNGTNQWSKRYGGMDGDYAYDLAVDSGNNIVITGQVAGSVGANQNISKTSIEIVNPPDYGAQDIIILGLNSSGAYSFIKRLGGAGNDMGFAAAFDSNNRFIIAGYITGNADLNGDGDFSDGDEAAGNMHGARDIFICRFP